ncbi:MAG TPA: DUF305 domain-containing protein [Gemmatimonadales bacterium]|nr:DUF305 domain-containing protein [Gemmatimonadales bacterium]
MIRARNAGRLPLLVLVAAVSACSRAPAEANQTPEPVQVGPEHLPPSPADVKFMGDMIGHHAQAIRISRWAPSHGASPAVQRLAERIVVGQQDEITIMQRWLRTNAQPAVEPDTAGHGTMDHSAHMPGMLSPEDLARLDAARGAEFDRLFLTYMIRHHQGALKMVDDLFGSQGAAQNDTVFRLASDVYAEQTTEIGRMQSMLDALPAEGAGR